MITIIKAVLRFLYGPQDSMLTDCRHIGESLKTNAADFVDLKPTGVEGLVLINQFGDALTAQKQGGKANTIYKNAKKKETITLMRSWANQVEAIAQNNAELFEKSGFPRNQPPGPKHNMPKGIIKLVKDGTHSGNVDALAVAIRNAKNYQFRFTTLNPVVALENDWTYENPSPTRKTIRGLTPGVFYFFQVRANGALDSGEWSEPYMFMVR